MSTVISVVGLTKVFRDFWHRARVRAVNDIDFQIESGEIYGLLGPNGSGKSTTIKMILGLLHPTRGRITVFNQPPDSVRTKMRIGYLPEESYLYRFLNARETLDYYATLFQIPRRERKRRIEELLEMVGLKGAARRPVGEYSKGMARRIGLAQALINDPDLLILDEPTSGLDPVGSKLVKDIIIRLGREFNKTILLSSHLLSDVEEVCQRVAILFGGKIQVKGTMQEVLSQQDKVQITSDKLSPAAIEKIRQIIAAESPNFAISTPRDRLESLFLRIVEQAHSQRVETAGAQSAGDIAGFLGAQPGGREVLESLMRTEEVAAEKPAAAQESRPAVDTDVLAALSSAKAAPQEEAAEPASPAEVDRGVLDSLTGKEGSDDR